MKERVEYPLELDLFPYMTSPGGCHMYDLYAVIVYDGSGLLGHYFCYIQKSGGHWFHANDAEVSCLGVLPT